jgi:HEAT repeat protein
MIAAASAFTPNDPVLIAAFWTGIGALALTLALGAQIVRLRMALRARSRRDARVLARWRPLLNAAIMGETPDALPPLARADRLHFIKLWVHLQASLRGEASAGLNDVARRLGLEIEARAMLGRRGRVERLLAALLLGHMKDREAWPALLRMTTLGDVTVSLTALWALVRIDPQAAAEVLTPMFVERDDWAMSHVAAILKQASGPVAAVLTGMLPHLGEARLPRALRIAEALRIQLPDDLMPELLVSSDIAVVTGALRTVETPGLLARVRPLLGHYDWQVRVQAAKALGRIGAAEDVGRLAALLSDREWWVRYRAAQALLELPWMGAPELAALQASLTDRFAADILAQAIAEQGAGDVANRAANGAANSAANSAADRAPA